MIGSIILIAIGVLFLTMSMFAKFRMKNKDMLSFVLTILATFIGVFLAADFSSKQENRNEEFLTIKLLEAGRRELKVQIKRTENIYKLASSGNDSTYTVEDHLRNNPLHQPRILTSSYLDPIFRQHVSAFGITNVLSISDNLLSIENSLNPCLLYTSPSPRDS